jgi:hypothetical protein
MNASVYKEAFFVLIPDVEMTDVHPPAQRTRMTLCPLYKKTPTCV